MKNEFPNASKSFLALNPNLLVGPVPSAERQRASGPALGDETPRTKESRKIVGRRSSRGAVLRIAIVAQRHCLHPDTANWQFGFKQLQDAIAAWFALDDADDTIRWEYAQIQTDGPEGTLVVIEAL